MRKMDMMREDLACNAERLLEIKESMEDMMGEVREILEGVPHEVDGGMTWERAKAYWWAHITMALSDNHDFLGGRHTDTMEGTANELEKMAYGNEDGDE